MIEILKIIRVIREVIPSSVDIFTKGKCFEFCRLLKEIFPEGEIHYDSEHFIFKHEGKYYDITGEINSERHLPIIGNYDSQKLIKMKLQTQLSHAIYLASLYHNNVYDKAGEPYILHVLWVMNKVRHLGHKYMIVAVLHDILEDTAMTIPYLKKHIFEDEVLEALKLLTHTEGRYDSYINKIIDSGNDIAIQVKLRDLEHNSKITRLKGIEDKDVERMKKYHKSYMKLKKYRK